MHLQEKKIFFKKSLRNMSDENISWIIFIPVMVSTVFAGVISEAVYLTILFITSLFFILFWSTYKRLYIEIGASYISIFESKSEWIMKIPVERIDDVHEKDGYIYFVTVDEVLARINKSRIRKEDSRFLLGHG